VNASGVVKESNSFISSSLNSKSKTSAFSIIRSFFTDFGM
jgi:hypothetical protein